MTEPEQYDAVVIGSGEGGKYLAWHLAKAGQRTAVIERRWLATSRAARRPALELRRPEFVLHRVVLVPSRAVGRKVRLSDHPHTMTHLYGVAVMSSIGQTLSERTIG